MRIERIADKQFRLTITEKEAEFICDSSEMNELTHNLITINIGNSVLFFMAESCIRPHAAKPMVVVELISNGP